MGNYSNTVLINTVGSSSSTTGEFVSAGTTWDAAWGVRPIEYNGDVIRMGAPVVVSTPPTQDEGPLEWLRRRVDEVRVDLAA
jgi:hypothetical protein